MKKVLVGILVVITLGCLIFATLYKTGVIKLNDNDVTEGASELNDIQIKNSEIAELYEYVKVQERADACLMNYYQKPYNKATLEDKISLIYYTDSIKYPYNFTQDDINKLTDENLKNQLKQEYGLTGFVKTSYIIQDIKKIFNIDITEEIFNNLKGIIYIKELNVLTIYPGGGNYLADIYQKILNYEEVNDNISLTVVKAEILSYDENDNTPAGVYRDVNNPKTLVYEDVNNFKFTKDNIDKFPQIRYVFKKSNEGNYYLFNVENLNYKEDFNDYCN